MSYQDMMLNGLNWALHNAVGILITCGGAWIIYRIYLEYVKLKEAEE